MTDPIPGEVYDAALRLASCRTVSDDERWDSCSLVKYHARKVLGIEFADIPDAARKILLLAAENGVARVCRG